MGGDSVGLEVIGVNYLAAILADHASCYRSQLCYEGIAPGNIVILLEGSFSRNDLYKSFGFPESGFVPILVLLGNMDAEFGLNFGSISNNMNYVTPFSQRSGHPVVPHTNSAFDGRVFTDQTYFHWRFLIPISSTGSRQFRYESSDSTDRDKQTGTDLWPAE